MSPETGTKTGTRCPVSVVLTTYKRATALAETIDTILAQSFADFELIVCDDCSPDGTESVVREYQKRDDRIIYQRNQTNLGMPGNLNGGIRRARGEYIANVHDGDHYDRRLLERWKGALDRNPGVAFVFNQYAKLHIDGRVEPTALEPLPDVFPGSLLLEKIYFKRWRFSSPVWGTVMARRSAYVKAGLFDARFGFISDVDMWMRLAEEHDVAYVKEPLIGVAERDRLPRQVTIHREDRLLEQMFREARMRHYRGRPARRLLEAGRHGAFVAAYQTYLFLLRVNRLRRRIVRRLV